MSIMWFMKGLNSGVQVWTLKVSQREGLSKLFNMHHQKRRLQHNDLSKMQLRVLLDVSWRVLKSFPCQPWALLSNYPYQIRVLWNCNFLNSLKIWVELHAKLDTMDIHYCLCFNLLLVWMCVLCIFLERTHQVINQWINNLYGLLRSF